MAQQRITHRLLAAWLRPRQSPPIALPGAVDDGSRILAIDSGDLSDLLFHVPLLRGVRATYPGAQIDFLLPESHAPLVTPSGLARQCLVYSPAQLRPPSPPFWDLLRGVRRPGYDVALVMAVAPQPVLELVALGTRAALRIGPGAAGEASSLNLELRAAAPGGYRGSRPAGAAPLLGIPRAAAAAAWPLPADRLRQTRQLVGFHKPRAEEWLIGVDPTPGKCGGGLAASSLRFIVEQLAAHLPCRLLVLAPPGGRERAQAFEAGMSAPTLALPRDTLFETLLLLAQCDLFVAGNTDLLHFAVAMEIPALGLFTAQDGQEWDPGPRPRLRLLRMPRGQQIDIDSLLASAHAAAGRPARRAEADPVSPPLAPAPLDTDGD